MDPALTPSSIGREQISQICTGSYGPEYMANFITKEMRYSAWEGSNTWITRPCPAWTYGGPLYDYFHGDVQPETRDKVFTRNMAAIKNCDMLFAYIDTADCHGTLVEIGAAYVLGKPIYMVFAHGMLMEIDDFWFVIRCAIDTSVCKSKAQLIESYIDFLEREIKRRQIEQKHSLNQ
jgi:hypothetical protein